MRASSALSSTAPPLSRRYERARRANRPSRGARRWDWDKVWMPRKRRVRTRFSRSTRASADVIDVSDASSDDVRVRASASANPIVVLSGFGNCSSDYEDALGNDEASLAKSLRSRGFSVHVAEVERKDWFVGILRGIFTKGFWMNACTTRESYGWYLERVDACVKEALRANPEATSVDIVAHSAGGWLARAFIGGALAMNASEVECSGDFLKRDERVRRLICLGTPHAQDAKSDPTRGASKWGKRYLARRVL